jgi:hypothetical protein
MTSTEVIVGANAACLFEPGMTINLGTGTPVMLITRVDRSLGVLYLSGIRASALKRMWAWFRSLF